MWNVIESYPIVVHELLLGLQPWQSNLDSKCELYTSFVIMLVGAVAAVQGWLDSLCCCFVNAWLTLCDFIMFSNLMYLLRPSLKGLFALWLAAMMDIFVFSVFAYLMIPIYEITLSLLYGMKILMLLCVRVRLDRLVSWQGIAIKMVFAAIAGRMTFCLAKMVGFEMDDWKRQPRLKSGCIRGCYLMTAFKDVNGNHTQVVDAAMPGVWCCFLIRRSESHFSIKHDDDNNFLRLDFAQASITEPRVMAGQPHPGPHIGTISTISTGLILQVNHSKRTHEDIQATSPTCDMGIASNVRRRGLTVGTTSTSRRIGYACAITMNNGEGSNFVHNEGAEVQGQNQGFLAGAEVQGQNQGFLAGGSGDDVDEIDMVVWR
nr:hypothetical protein [Tanacetum cinerariifolium]